MRFLVDAQLPPAVARWLADRGHDADHVDDRGLGEADDRTIWAEAKRTGATIVSKDEDFVELRVAEAGGPAVVWVRLGNTTRAVLIRQLEAVWADVERSLRGGEGIVEIGR